MCIVCGSRIAPATATAGAGGRGWRLPVVLAALALLLVGTAIAFGIASLTSDDEVKKDDVADLSDDPKPTPTTPPPTTQPPPTTAPAPTIPPATREPQPTQPQDPPDDTPPTTPTTPDTPSGGGSVAEWPAGRTAYTVVLVSATSRNAADAKAEQAIKRGIQAGVLRSDDFSTLRPGYWVVFAGQYDSSEEATRAADRYAEQGFGGGYPRQVKPK
jgi:septal ring-binding cell division protein DamX